MSAVWERFMPTALAIESKLPQSCFFREISLANYAKCDIMVQAVRKSFDGTERSLSMSNEKLKNTVQSAVAGAEKVAQTVAETGKKAARQAKSKAAPKVDAAVKAAKETGKKAAAALNSEVYLQIFGHEYSCQELAERCKADFRANNKGAIRSCKLYVKPEDGMVYYVVNSKHEGKLPL